ncbi:MAG: bifunctional 5,10-methylenetetrahydrofolate dehydrogenase/5,10-methenyltetrahydrofolate cyclohydrolase [Candidatus Cloacimonetes bacterium]|nr:bifunctional 5,10-methylenetetrahydrofolate dehydrogenase/5,10-methenyltetrahydrofolate cyclohydrolase [Candidatus Cloacimonadota bacterium]
MAEILAAKPVVKEIFEEMAVALADLNSEPVLELFLIGHDPAAEWYVNNLVKQGRKRGICINLERFDVSITQQLLLASIRKCNEDKTVSGIMLQKPLPAHINEEEIIEAINPGKDVDGFHPQNLGKLLLEQDALLPCTPQAVLKILEYYQIETTGKHIVILGRSNIVGKPLANLLLRKSAQGNATVTVCHSRTHDIRKYCLEADIIIAAIGKAEFVKTDMVKKNAVIIDVGTNLIKDDNGLEKYVGDVDYKGVIEKVKAISPVPGGVGSVTTALLLRNVVKAAKLC